MRDFYSENAPFKVSLWLKIVRIGYNVNVDFVFLSWKLSEFVRANKIRIRPPVHSTNNPIKPDRYLTLQVSRENIINHDNEDGLIENIFKMPHEKKKGTGD